MTRDTEQVIERFTRALGPPIATPEWVMSADYRDSRRLERARYRVFRWRCPVCHAHLDDSWGIYRPLTVDSNGGVWCEANDCGPEQIAHEVRHLLEVEKLLGSLGFGS